MEVLQKSIIRVAEAAVVPKSHVRISYDFKDGEWGYEINVTTSTRDKKAHHGFGLTLEEAEADVLTSMLRRG